MNNSQKKQAKPPFYMTTINAIAAIFFFLGMGVLLLFSMLKKLFVSTHNREDEG